MIHKVHLYFIFVGQDKKCFSMAFTKPQINAPTSACYLGKLYVQSLKSFLLNADRTLGENVFRFFS